MATVPIAEKIFYNGRIYTVNENREWADAIAISGNKIIGVEKSKKEIEKHASATTEWIDLKGLMMLPGLIDAHAHPIWAGFIKSGILLNMYQTVKDIQETVREYIQNHPHQQVYFGQGYSEWMFDQNGPQKELLDEVCPDKPIILLGGGLHSGWCNSKALEIAGITKDTPDPDPGAQFYRRREDGTPNGSLVEGGPINSVIDAIQPFDESAVLDSLAKVSEEYTKAGVTAIHDGGSEKNMVELGRSLLIKLTSEKRFNQRVKSCEFVNTISSKAGVVDRIKESNKKYNSDFFEVNSLKVIMDGSFEARSAALLDPYPDGTIIHPLLEGDDLYELFENTASAGFDICIHAIGDWAARETLLAIKKLRESGYSDCRIAIIHCNYIDDGDFEMFQKYDVMANTTAIWHHKNVDKENIIGYERANKNFLMNRLYNIGVKVTFGSDHPADEYGKEPLKGIEMGTTRQMYGMPEDPILPPYSERLTVKKMIEGYTINAAYQMRMDDKIGSIEPGKFADLVVLHENLFEIDPHDIHNVEVAMTIADGRIVYQNKMLE